MGVRGRSDEPERSLFRPGGVVSLGQGNRMLSRNEIRGKYLGRMSRL